eukprot:175257-Prorocentrum_minimum.AAC.2
MERDPVGPKVLHKAALLGHQERPGEVRVRPIVHISHQPELPHDALRPLPKVDALRGDSVDVGHTHTQGQVGPALLPQAPRHMPDGSRVLPEDLREH